MLCANQVYTKIVVVVNKAIGINNFMQGVSIQFKIKLAATVISN